MMESIIFVLALIAEIIGTMAGFGSSTIFLPLALLFLDFKTALVLTAFLHIFGNISRLNFFKKGLDKNLLLKFGLPSVIASFLGASLVAFTNSELLKLVLGGFLIFYSFYSLKIRELILKANLETAVAGGCISGFLAGLIGTGGALRGVFLNSFKMEKAGYIATAAAIAILVDLTRLPVYINNGLLEPSYYLFVPILLVAALGGSFIGKTIVSKIDQNSFRKIVLVAIGLIGIKFILDFIF